MSYGGLPRSYDPKASRSGLTAPAPAGGSGFNPALRASLAAKTAANSPWPIDPASRPAISPRPDYSAFDNSKREEIAAMAPAKSAADLTAFAGRLEANAFHLATWLGFATLGSLQRPAAGRPWRRGRRAGRCSFCRLQQRRLPPARYAR